MFVKFMLLYYILSYYTMLLFMLLYYYLCYYIMLLYYVIILFMLLYYVLLYNQNRNRVEIESVEIESASK